jgi:hypothetical protein
MLRAVPNEMKSLYENDIRFGELDGWKKVVNNKRMYRVKNY